MYKYKKLQTLINYIVTKHGNTPQGASKITVSLLVQEVTQRAGKGRCYGQRPERLSPYKKQVVIIPKAMYKLHSRKRMPRETHQHGTAGGERAQCPQSPTTLRPQPLAVLTPLGRVLSHLPARSAPWGQARINFLRTSHSQHSEKGHLY